MPIAARRPFVGRERLITTLNAALDPPGFAARLTLVSAPAGFGKTTLIAHWLSLPATTAVAPAIAWISLEPMDNDPGRFGAVLSAALAEAFSDRQRFAFGAAETQPSAFILRVLSALQDVGPVILALDDYHVISDPAIHEAVGLLLDRLPPSAHVVILSRTDPPINLARRRVRQEMTEIRVSDLRFSPAEAGAYLNDVMHLELSEDDVTVLERRTEGWIAGLQLAAHSLRLSDDRTGFLAGFAGDDRFVADYLLEEVLLRQPAERQVFLLETSILDRLHPDLVEAVTGRPGGHDLLLELEHDNLFLVPLDNRRQWYRYHRLFADLLRRRLTERHRDLRPYHQRAARWYADNGMLLEAVDHAFEADDQAMAADLISTVAPSLFLQSRLVTMAGWFSRLRREELVRRSPLCLGMAWAWLATGHPAEAEVAVALAEQAVGCETRNLCGDVEGLSAQQMAVLIEASAVRSRLDVDRLAVDDGLRLARCGFDHVDHVIASLVGSTDPPLSFNPPQGIRPVLLFNMGLAQYLKNDLDSAARAFAATADEATDNGHLIALSLGHLAGVERLRGRLRQAEATAVHGLGLVEQIYGNQSPLSGLLMAHLGGVCYDRGALDKAGEWWRRAAELAGPWGNWEALLPAWLGMARLAQTTGDREAALLALKQLEIHTATHSEITGVLVSAHREWFNGAVGHMPVPAPAHLLEALPLLADQVVLCRARALLASEQSGEAIEPLMRLARAAAASERYGILVEAKVLLAEALALADRQEEALDTLDQALALSAGEGIVQPFREAGPVVTRMLETGLAADRLSGFAETVLGRRDTGTSSALPATARLTDLGPDGGVLEALTEREREVLELIATGLSNREIGDRLYVTEGTVKNHAHNIYEKLGVGGRTQALARARALGYLTR